MYRTAIGKRIVKLREKKGWSQEELGFKSGITSTAIGLIERGVSKKPHPTTLAKLAIALGDTGQKVKVTDISERKGGEGQGYHGTKTRISYQPQLGINIEELREAKGWTKATLSHKSGVHYSSMNRVLLQKSKYMLPVKVEKIAKVLGVTADYLIGKEKCTDDTFLLKDTKAFIMSVVSDLTFRTVTHLTDSVKKEYRKGFREGVVTGVATGISTSILILLVLGFIASL